MAQNNLTSLPQYNQITYDLNIAISRGLVPGHSLVNTQALNPDVGTAFEEISDQGGNTALPTAAESWEVLSASANDAAAGTGLRTLLVESLDANYNTQTQVVTLNGTTPVALTGTHLRTRRMVGLTGDPAVAAINRVNAGNITLRVAGGGATRLLMLAGNSTTFSSVYTVPAGFTAYGSGFSAFAPRNDDVQFKAIVTPFGTNTATISGGSFLLYESGFHLPQTLKFPLQEKTDLRFEAKSGVGSSTVSTLFDIILIKNGM